MARNDFVGKNPSDLARYSRIMMEAVITTRWNTFMITETWHTDENTTYTGRVGTHWTINGFTKMTWTHLISLQTTSPPHWHEHPCNKLEEGEVQRQHAQVPAVA